MSIEEFKIYKSKECGAIVEVLSSDASSFKCGCNKDLLEIEPKTADSAGEKHVPLIECTATGYKITVGSTPHPMQEDHLIEWIELIVDDTVYRKHLKPGVPPVAEFNAPKGKSVIAREYCNLHGLWKN